MMGDTDSSPHAGVGVAIVIPVYNGKDCIEECLNAVLETTDNTIIYVVDNGSDDGSRGLIRSIVERRPNRVRPIYLDRNLGFPAACNAGIRQALEAGAPYVVLLNQDAFPRAGWLASLVTAAESDRTYGAIQALILLEGSQPPPRINTAGNLMHYLGFSWCGSFGAAAPAAEGALVREVATASGAALLLTREALLDVGLLDETFFLYHEDADLCWRMRLAGYRVGVAPAARVVHRYSQVTSSRKFCFAERNRLAFLLKTASWKRLLIAAPLLVVTGVASILVAAAKGWSKEYLLSMAGLLRTLGKTIASRKSVQAKRRVRERDLVHWLSADIDAQGIVPDRFQKAVNALMRGYWGVAHRLL